MIKITESPREAFQACEKTIPTDLKVKYINALMKVGYDIVETGSLVSPKLVPQVSDTMDVIKKLDFSETRSAPMVLLVNKKGADMIAEVDEITHICYPLPVSETFARLNLNATIEQCLDVVDHISNIAIRKNKEFIVYISMAYGNNYGDEWSLEILSKWVGLLVERGIKSIPLSNVSVEADPEKITSVMSAMMATFPGIDFGLHLHTQDHMWFERVEAAYNAGCRSYDGVMRGMGGCPITGGDMLANLAMERLVHFLRKKNDLPEGFNEQAFLEAGKIATEIFGMNALTPLNL